MSKAIIDDVAKAAGVSIKTVSRVMNKEPNVRPATREKVLAAAKQLNYKPNVSARGLAGNKTFLMALVYDNPNPSYLINMQRGILETCEAEGYGMVMKPVNFNGSQSMMDQVNDFMAQSPVDGLILTPPVCDNITFKKQLSEKGIPFVSVAPPDEGDELAVLINDLGAAKDMMRYFIENGHKKIGYIKGHPDHGASQLRYDGYCAALQDADINVSNDYTHQGYFTFECGVKAAEKFMGLENKPTAIFASNDEMAAGAIHYLLDNGYRIPKDVSVAGFDDIPISRQIWPTMTTVRQPIRKMGQIAAETLLNKLKNRDGESIHNIPHTLIFRNSTHISPEQS